MPIDARNVRGLIRAVAYDARGSRLGRVAQVFLDDRTDEPAWVAVDVTRTRGMRLLPLAGAGLRGRYLVIRADRSTVRSAPRVDLADGQLSSQDESRLHEHYGLTGGAGGPAAETGGRTGGAGDPAADAGGSAGSDGPAESGGRVPTDRYEAAEQDNPRPPTSWPAQRPREDNRKEPVEQNGTAQTQEIAAVPRQEPADPSAR